MLCNRCGLSVPCRIASAKPALIPWNSSFFGMWLRSYMNMTAISEVFFQSCLHCICKRSTDLIKNRKTHFLSWQLYDQGLTCMPLPVFGKGFWRKRSNGFSGDRLKAFINICKIAALVFLVALNSTLLFQTTALGYSPMLYAVRVLS